MPTFDQAADAILELTGKVEVIRRIFGNDSSVTAAAADYLIAMVEGVVREGIMSAEEAADVLAISMVVVTA